MRNKSGPLAKQEIEEKPGTVLHQAAGDGVIAEAADGVIAETEAADGAIAETALTAETGAAGVTEGGTFLALITSVGIAVMGTDANSHTTVAGEEDIKRHSTQIKPFNTIKHMCSFLTDEAITYASRTESFSSY